MGGFFSGKWERDITHGKAGKIIHSNDPNHPYEWSKWGLFLLY
jgi:hypothetical protein